MIYIYDDKRTGWGKIMARLLSAADCKLFSKASEVDGQGFVYMHPTHLPIDQRNNDKAIMQELDKRDELTLIPSAREVALYDDKVAQYQEFGNWMPDTLLASDRETALSYIGRLGFPFVSKSAMGAGASNVRLIRNKYEALAEIYIVFSDGIAGARGGVQKDYMLWQKWVAGLEINWRVVVLANKYFIVTKRWNEKDKKFVNDRGRIETLIELDDDAKEMVNFAKGFVQANCFKWVAIDIIKESKNKKLYVLETSTGWPMWWFDNGMIFNKDLGPVEYAKDVLYLVGDMFKEGDFD